MTLGFKRRFEAKILSKEKRHTIRDFRKGLRQWRVGDICDCFVDARQKTMRLLGRWPCVRVQEIFIGPDTRFDDIAVSIDDTLLSVSETENLAISDGFESFAEMLTFWEGRLPFYGVMIHWDPDTEIPAPADRKTKANRIRQTQKVA